jgi:hypothetical protein
MSGGYFGVGAWGLTVFWGAGQGSPEPVRRSYGRWFWAAFSMDGLRGAKAGGMRCRLRIGGAESACRRRSSTPAAPVRSPGACGSMERAGARLLFPGLKARTFTVLPLRGSFCAGVRLLGVVVGWCWGPLTLKPNSGLHLPLAGCGLPQVLRLRLARAPTFAQDDICLFCMDWWRDGRKAGACARLLFPGLKAPSAWLGTGSDFFRAAFGLALARLRFAGVFVRGFGCWGWLVGWCWRPLPLKPNPGLNGPPSNVGLHGLRAGCGLPQILRLRLARAPTFAQDDIC